MKRSRRFERLAKTLMMMPRRFAPAAILLVRFIFPSRRAYAQIQNGEDLLSEILKRRGLFGPPVIVITGHGTDDPKLARRVLTEGAVDFVKPFPVAVQPHGGPGNGSCAPGGGPSSDNNIDTQVTERQQWILTELSGSRCLKVPDIVARLRVSARTARRDLDALCTAGRIEFVGPSRTGHYRIRR